MNKIEFIKKTFYSFFVVWLEISLRFTLISAIVYWILMFHRPIVFQIWLWLLGFITIQVLGGFIVEITDKKNFNQAQTQS